MVRDCQLRDSARLCEIYNHYIKSSVCTFELEPISEDEMAARIQATTEHYPWIVFDTGAAIEGYAYATAWKSRGAYRNTVESTVYVDANCSGRGTGTILLESLIDRLKPLEVHAVLAGIALPNESSVALHEKLGFSKVAHFKETGKKFGEWIDVGYWELLTN